MQKFEELKQQVLSCIDGVEDIDGNQNLVELGLNSLKIMRLAAQWKRKGIQITFSQLMDTPTLDNWFQKISGQKTSETIEGCIAQEEIHYEKEFPLTDVQYAYWIGRQDEQLLGGVGCHAYLEFDGKNLDTERIKRAWDSLLHYHPMLHARFTENGTQLIMREPCDNPVEFVDLRENNEAECERNLETLRNKISHRKLEIENGKCIGLTVTLLPDNCHRIHFDLDLLVADVQSMNIILRDFVRFYCGDKPVKDVSTWSFENYLMNENKDAESFEEAKKYWKKRIESLPVGPALPLAKQPEEIRQFRIERKLGRLEKAQWDKIKEKASKYQVTPAMVLLTAYATVLERWSTNSDFLINIPLFNRKTDVENVEETVADFTTLVLLEVHGNDATTFSHFLLSLKKQFYEDINYKAYSGVKVQRDMARLHPGQNGIAPVVFACNLGTPLIDEKFRQNLGDFHYMVSQTPQVWLDYQTYEDENGLMLAWDVLCELFPEHMIDDMFCAFTGLLNRLAQEDWEQVMDVLPEAQKQRRIDNLKINAAQPHYLHTAFLEHALENPDHTALIDSASGQKITYGDLATLSLKIGEYLNQRGIENQPIAMTLPRGTMQIGVMYGILAGGNHYVPVNVGQPLKRRRMIHEKVGIQYVITDEATAKRIEWPEQITVLTIEEILNEAESYSVPSIKRYLETLPEADLESSAYIIMTSGSTGEPKGVEISHSAAWNTIKDINEKYGINEKDTAFAISAIDFDLSVYDTFGILGAGGSLVVIMEEQKKDAFYWLENVMKYGVTVWNSVPTLLDMLLLAYEEKNTELLPIRVAMLSGDWINLNLPERLKKATHNSEFIAMGGATEASIWSNYCEVTLPLPMEWKSIPYGQPLKNQVYRVVDMKGRDCPDWVKGELYIGGAGVAKGYKGDAELSARKFTDEDGMRFYHTGDFGRFWSDATIEFLGRMDYQVKVGGYRIELGEVESALEAVHGINKAAVIALGEERHLAAYIVLDDKKCDEICEKRTISESKLQEEWTKAERSLISEGELPDAEENEILEKQLCDCVALAMVQILKELGMEETEDLNQFVMKVAIIESYRPVLQRIADYLKAGGFVTENECSTIITVKEPMEYNQKISAIVSYVKEVSLVLKDIFKGTKTASDVFYRENVKLSPMNALKNLPFYEKDTQNYLLQISDLMKQFSEKKWRIVEIGSQNLDLTCEFLEQNGNRIESYLYVVPTGYFMEEALLALQNYPMVHVEIADEKYIGTHDYDLLLGFHTIHQCCNVNKHMRQYADYLKQGGYAVFAELLKKQPVQELTASVLEQGFVHYDDLRKQEKRPLFTGEELQKILRSSGFEKNECRIVNQYDIEKTGIFVAQYTKDVRILEEDKLKAKMSQYLPDYMIPRIMTVMDELPITSNGKIDRKQLAKCGQTQLKQQRTEREMTDSEMKLAAIWGRLFGRDDISASDNYFELGGDSLTATKLISVIRKEEGIEIPITTIFEHPSVEQLAVVLEQKRHANDVLEGKHRDLAKREGDLINRYESFPLTDVQYAYWIGRSGLYSLGQVGTHCYFELDMMECDYKRLNESFNQLIRMHDMMRAIILTDGRQCILKEIPAYEIQLTDVSADTEESTRILNEIREEMSHQVIDTANWPLFDIRATRYEKQKTRLHISFDNIILDGWSMFHILGEWQKFYHNTLSNAVDYVFSFRDYVLALDDIKKTVWYEEDKEYWTKRIPDFPKAPELPIVKRPEEIEIPHFARKEAIIEKKNWEFLKQKAKKMGITPSVLLLTAYAETLRLWSKNSHFAINLTQFNRLPVHSEVDCLVGDFTTLTLLEINRERGNSFVDRAKKLQTQLLKDLEHSYFSGVEMQRELTAYANNQTVNIPIVFTSGLGVDQWNEGSWIGELVYNISQTPQVWLDHQVVERDGALCLFWDYVEALFDPDMMDEMFAAYNDLLNNLAKDESIWKEDNSSLVYAPISLARKMANETEGLLPEKTLDGEFLTNFSAVRERKAVITEDRTLTYEELANYAAGVCVNLKNEKHKKQEVVGIYMEKGWQQIAAVYGILFAGGVYLPLDVHNPAERIEKIIANSGLKLVLTTKEYEDKLSEIQGINVLVLDETMCGKYSDLPKESVNSVDDLAYIIYTSGSTGLPKGVAVTHGGAMNTINDINCRYKVTQEDTVIALSNLHFDLSVYDIFGLLSVGGSMVIPSEKHLKDPKYWLEQIKQNHISIWNTVPAFMQMLITYMKGKTPMEESSLRQVLMSGDWIPVTLPDEIRYYFPGAKIVGLGGATEASIWSNIFDIPDQIPDNWKSIPYGKPLRNQYYYILNEDLRDCPDGVIGTLYIAGDGLAKEYYHDEVKTSEKFFIHKEKKVRIYCTGDMGRYWKDGNIEFLGREDDQVKINGYRVELGEIENALKQCTGEKEVVAIAISEHELTYTAGFVVGDEARFNTERMKEELKKLLPEYMIPAVICVIPKMQLSGNGKVDRKALAQIASDLYEKEGQKKEKQVLLPENETERKMYEIWKTVLKYEKLSVEDHFFEIGGNSLQAIHLVNAINEAFSSDLGIDKLFDFPTVKKLSEYFSSEQ